MSKLMNIFPKESVYLVLTFAIFMCLLLFRLSWQELLIVLIIDTISFCFFNPSEKKIFTTIFKKFNRIIDAPEKRLSKEDSRVSQNDFFNLLAQFPEVRCIYGFFMSYIKVLPVAIYVSYVSNVSSFSENLVLFYLVQTFIFIFWSGLLFIELHQLSSDIMKDFALKEEWRSNYSDLKLVKADDRFSLVQNIILVSMLCSLLFMVVYLSQKYSLNADYKLIIFFTTCILCIGSVQLKFQRYFKGAMKEMFTFFDQDFVAGKLKVLPYHTSPILAGFEYSFNQLGQKLEQREKEISQWLKHESGQYHLRSLGEVAAMVAHDIKTPLGVMQMALEMMNAPDASVEDRRKYEAIVERNLKQAISFTQTLMAYVRGSKEGKTCKFRDVHEHLINLFETQFFVKDLESVKISVSEELMDVSLQLDRLDVMHVFYNLYQNALKSIISNETSGEIRMWCEKDLKINQVSIFIHNTGSTLSEEDFQGLVSFERFKGNDQFYNGLGLRVTHAILSHLDSKLEYVPVDLGTCMKVIVSIADGHDFFVELEPNIGIVGSVI